MPNTKMCSSSIQHIARKYNKYLEDRTSNGIIMMDSRSAHQQKGKGVDYTIAKHYMQYIFANQTGKTLKRIIEAPLFADSSVVAGIQVADIIAGCLNGYQTYKYVGFSAENELLDYSHMEKYESELHELSYVVDRNEKYTEYSYDVYDCNKAPVL